MESYTTETIRTKSLKGTVIKMFIYLTNKLYENNFSLMLKRLVERGIKMQNKNY